MQLTTLVALVSAAAVSATSLPPPPPFVPGQPLNTAGLTACGFQCYQKNVALATICDPADMLCLCTNDPFHQGMLPCLINMCEFKDLKNTFEWVGRGCKSAVGAAQKRAELEVKAALKQAQEAQRAKKGPK